MKLKYLFTSVSLLVCMGCTDDSIPQSEKVLPERISKSEDSRTFTDGTSYLLKDKVTGCEFILARLNTGTAIAHIPGTCKDGK